VPFGLISLTDTAYQAIHDAAKLNGISLSEFVERWGRNTVRLRIFRHNFGHVETCHGTSGGGFRCQSICLIRTVLDGDGH
jgi:hypothetical protein